MLDAVVIGAGPSGAHFAAQAAKKGYTVKIVEKGQLGRPKCCAGGLSDRFLETYRVPERLIERGIDTCVMVSPTGERTELKFNRTAGVTVNRTNFDRWTAEQAMVCGCEILFDKAVKNISVDKEKAEITLSDNQTLSARLIIGAFGLSPQVFRLLGLQAPEFSLGLQAEVEVPTEAIDSSVGNEIEFFFNSKYSKSGYSWVFPKKQAVSFGLVANPHEAQKKEHLFSFVSDYVSAHLQLKQYLPADFCSLQIGAAMLPNTALERTYGDRFMLLGDAAGLIDPTTWEGIYFAYKSADIALEAMEENYDSDFSMRKLSSYQNRWRQVLGKEVEFGRRIQRRAYGPHMDRLWKFAIHELNSNIPLKQLVTDELSKDLSIANMVETIPLSTKLRLVARYGRERRRQ